MRKYLLKITFFFIPILLTAYYADILLSNSLKTSRSGEYGVWNDIYNGNVNSDIVIYGSSRAWVHIDPEIISKNLNLSAYNMGMDGHNLWLQYLRHSLLLQYNVKPKIIIHSIDIFTLDKRKELYKPDQFLPYMLNNELMEKATSSYEGYNLFDYKIPMIRYFGRRDAISHAINLIITPSRNLPDRKNGYQGQDETWNDDFIKAKVKMKEYEIKFDAATIKLFDEYLHECRNKGIKVILVYTPEYIEGQKFVKNREEMLKLFINFSLKYNIPFWNYSNDAISFKKNYFYNSSHMNKKGAELFTNKLTNALKEYIEKNTAYRDTH
jgi:hypothetical protein